jgi:hypothetical protein
MLRPIVVGVLGLFAACGGGRALPGETRIEDVEQYCRAYSDAYCGMLARCGYHADKASCMVANRWCWISAKAIALGRIRFDPEAAARCIATRFPAGTCVVGNADWENPSCARVVRGNIPDGARCFDSLECAPTSFCDGGCPGVCRPARRAQETVALDEACAPGLYPGSFNADGTRRCEAPIPGGASCALPNGRSCHPDYFCDSAGSEACVPRRLPGEPCNGDWECTMFFICRGGVCAPHASAGETCPDSPTCQEGLYCTDDTAGVCRRMLGSGEGCGDRPDVCAEGCYCDGWWTGAGVCRPRRRIHEPCHHHEDCESRLACVNGTCVTSWCWDRL